MASMIAARSIAARPARVAVRPQANINAKIASVGKAAGLSLASFAVALAAHADASVKLGSDNGGLVFDPSSVTIKAGESVTWTNNAGYPHNIVFDEDAIPAGADADALSHEDLLNAPGESVSSKFTVAGTYNYYCDPHQGAGMKGTVTVQ